MASPTDRALAKLHSTKLPVPDDAQDAIRTLIRWSGDDPDHPRFGGGLLFAASSSSNFEQVFSIYEGVIVGR